MARDERLQRLRAAVLAAPPDEIREAARRLPEATIRALPAQARPLAAQLKRASNAVELLRRAPNAQLVMLLADDLTDEALAATRGALGDAADDPTREQLVAALDRVLEHIDVAIVRLMLATVAVGEAEAADICDDLLLNDERFALPTTETAAVSSSARPPKEVDEEKKARRRERKEAEREAKRQAAAREQARHQRKKSPPSTPPPAADDPPAVASSSRRAPALSPDEARAFDGDDPLVGAVVLATVAFEDDLGAKVRPCVVIGGSGDELLVRPGYSEGGSQSRRWQSHELRDWVAAGLELPTWIEHDTRTVPRADASEPIGRLTDADWNGLW